MLLLLTALLIAAAPAAPTPTPGIDLTAIDKTVAPGDGFFAYANGAWLKTAEIPADKASFGVWDVLIDAAREHTVEIIQDAAKHPERDADSAKIGDFYATYMDEAALEAKGVTPLTAKLDAIAALKDKKELARALGQTLRADVDSLNNTDFYTPHVMGLWVAQALDEPTQNTPYLFQGGLGLPDRDYYLSRKPEQLAVRTKYEAYLAQLLTLAGQKDATAQARRVVALETKLAQAHATRTDSNDVHLVQAWPREAFGKKAPGLDWTAFFEAAQLTESKRVFLWQPKAITGLAALVGSEKLSTWKEWLTVRALAERASLLSRAFADADFDFNGKVLEGRLEQRDRWKRGVDLTSEKLGEVVGKRYVQKYFPPEAKVKAQAMVDAVVKAFGQRLAALPWMSPATKAKAQEKVATLRVGVGYPDHWSDASSLQIVKGDLVGNVERVEAFEYQQALAKLKQPVDRDEWWMTPQTINAVNLPLQNALNFPAAILQPPFFDPSADPAANFGAIGAIIGHEISHSFDDSGAEFDATGKLSNWWTPEDQKHFKAAGDALVKQVDGYEPLPGVHLNGRQTLSENIADVAGVAVAFDAYQATAGATKAPISGLTGEQRFFIAFAQTWRVKMREPMLRKRIIGDGHAPGMFRPETVRNLDGWYTAFDVKPGQHLALPAAERVRIW
jgi:predicted metalloendopeptidase